MKQKKIQNFPPSSKSEFKFESKFSTRSRTEFHGLVHYYLNWNWRFPIFPFLILQLALQAYIVKNIDFLRIILKHENNVNLQPKDLNRFAAPDCTWIFQSKAFWTRLKLEIFYFKWGIQTQK